MYMGRLVELADNASLFGSPKHPYTRALLDSVPVPDPVVAPKRAPLRGEVGSLVNPPPGCVFHPRCPIAAAICSNQAPTLVDHAGTRVACHLVKG
jgi:oligopeptide/dipeptide ABC transporter ATP-binding protein